MLLSCIPRNSGGTGSARPYAAPWIRAELRQCVERVLLADLFGDLTVGDAEDGRTSETHLSTRSSRQLTDGQIVERRAGMGAAAIPAAGNIVALGDQFADAPEIEVGERPRGAR